MGLFISSEYHMAKKGLILSQKANTASRAFKNLCLKISYENVVKDFLATFLKKHI